MEMRRYTDSSLRTCAGNGADRTRLCVFFVPLFGTTRLLVPSARVFNEPAIAIKLAGNEKGQLWKKTKRQDTRERGNLKMLTGLNLSLGVHDGLRTA
jgi:hypothetical protein